MYIYIYTRIYYSLYRVLVGTQAKHELDELNFMFTMGNIFIRPLLKLYIHVWALKTRDVNNLEIDHKVKMKSFKIFR